MIYIKWYILYTIPYQASLEPASTKQMADHQFNPGAVNNIIAIINFEIIVGNIRIKSSTLMHYISLRSRSWNHKDSKIQITYSWATTSNHDNLDNPRCRISIWKGMSWSGKGKSSKVFQRRRNICFQIHQMSWIGRRSWCIQKPWQDRRKL